MTEIRLKTLTDLYRRRIIELEGKLAIAIEALEKYKYVSHDAHDKSVTKWSAAAEALAALEKMR